MARPGKECPLSNLRKQFPSRLDVSAGTKFLSSRFSGNDFNVTISKSEYIPPNLYTSNNLSKSL